MRVSLANLNVGIEGVPIVQDVTLCVEPGEMVGLIGPNGSGKSTLLRAIYRALRPVAGAVLLDERDVWAQMSARDSARQTAVVAQERPSEFDFSVLEVVATGRTPHKKLLERENADDQAIIAEALKRVGMAGKAGRIFASLSGGEKQRVLVARALAQQSRVLVLDEPTNHLDIRAQLELLELVKSLNLTIIAALHDMNLAAAYCNRLYVLQGGGLVAQGKIEDVLTPALLETVFGVRAFCDVHPLTGRFHIVFTPLH